MKICIGSDLHLEFGRGDLQVPECDVLLLAGDIFVPHLDDQKKNAKDKLKKRYKAFFKEISEKCGQTFMIMGNHEHYGGFFLETKDKINHYLEPFPNIRLLDNEAVALSKDVVLFGATMWTDYKDENPEAMMICRNRMSDHEVIFAHRGSGLYDVTERFLPRHAARENQYTREKIVEFLSKYRDNKVTIVMTHHAPSWVCVGDMFKLDIMSYGYANTGLDDMLLDGDGPDFWIHGHMHKRDVITHGATRIICNARGYFGHQRTDDFTWREMNLEILESE